MKRWAPRRRPACVDIRSPGSWNKRTGWLIYKGMRDRMLTAALLLSFVACPDASEPLSMAVSPVQSFAPTILAIRVHVDPDPDDRALEVVAESGVYYRSSRIQLDGTEAPRTISLEFRNVPAGEYDVRGVLFNSSGHERAVVRKHVSVIDSAESE